MWLRVSPDRLVNVDMATDIIIEKNARKHHVSIVFGSDVTIRAYDGDADECHRYLELVWGAMARERPVYDPLKDPGRPGPEEG